MSDKSASQLPEHQKPEVAIAILYRQLEKSHLEFLLQLRDDIPTIAYPGHWGFFGGHLEPGESADEAMRRELLEEIGYAPPHLTHFDTVEAAKSIRHVYASPLTLSLHQLTLHEGWDMAFVSIEEVKRGECFSASANQLRPIGKPHQNLLLLFIDQWLPPSPLAKG